MRADHDAAAERTQPEWKRRIALADGDRVADRVEETGRRRASPARRRALVTHPGPGHEHDGETRLPHTERQLDVLDVHEQRLVQTTHAFERGPRQRECRAVGAAHVTDYDVVARVGSPVAGEASGVAESRVEPRALVLDRTSILEQDL